MKLLRFFVIHSLRDMWRNRSRTAFALLCVAAGVSAIVALRSLAFMIGDELTTNLAQLNRGDIRLYATRDLPQIAEMSSRNAPVFSPEGEQAIRAWARQEGVDIMEGRQSVAQLRRISAGQSRATSVPILTLFVEPDRYPFYDTISLSAPDTLPLSSAFPPHESTAEAVGSLLAPKLAALGSLAADPWFTPFQSLGTYTAHLLAHPRPIVISSNLMRTSELDLHVGDIVRVGASDMLYRVAGVVPAESELALTNPETMLLDYVYLPMSDLPVLGEPPLPDQIFVKVPLGQSIESTESNLIKTLYASFDLKDVDLNKDLRRTSVPQLEKDNKEVADVIDKMILVMGLSSLLIGGIGIINTMLVVVSRRTLEIAVLKTLGLKGYRITVLFLVEAILMGLIGSLIGAGVGVVLSYAIKQVGEDALNFGLVWRVYPAAIFSGILLGMVITMLFGFLPTLIAGQVRPAIVLRPNEAQMPAAGLLQILFTLIVMILVLGLMVNSIAEGSLDFGPLYMLVGAGALLGLFSGVILSNTRLGKPLPDYYQFQLSRRFEHADERLMTAVGSLAVWSRRDEFVAQRGRRTVTGFVRGLRQFLLLYGALAIGALLASLAILVLAEMWKPAGFGDVKPSDDIVHAISRGEWGWVSFWLGLTLAVGLPIRVYARKFGGMIGLASLGTTFGGLLGLLGGLTLSGLLSQTGIWPFMERISTGIVLTEGALAVLAAVFVGYWLLVWLVSKMGATGLMGVVSLTLLVLMGVIAFAITSLGAVALLGLILLAILFWIGQRFKVAQRVLPQIQVQPNGASEMAKLTVQSTSVVMLSVAGLAGGFALVHVVHAGRWMVVLPGLLIFLALWRVLRRRYRVDGRLILREMAGRRGRIASTLLGLSVGITGLSVISLTASSVTQLFRLQMQQNAEGNLLVIAQQLDQRDRIQETLKTLPGVESYAQYTVYNGVLMEINGEPVKNPHAQHGGMGPGDGEQEPGIRFGIAERSDINSMPDYQMDKGHSLQPSDVGKPRVLVRNTVFMKQLGVDVGDRLLFVFENGPGDGDDVSLIMNVVGLVSPQSERSAFGDQILVPPGAIPAKVQVETIVTIAQVDESSDVYMENALVAMADIPGTFALELSALTQLLQNLIDQLKAIPTLVAWLALMAGTAIIANTVALATQERRREIGVMKAVGLKGWRVLMMLMIENGLIGLIAGCIGNGVGIIITVIMVVTAQSPDELRQILDWSTMGWLMLLSVGVSMGAAALSAWSAAAEKPMNVLRYE